MLTEPAFIEEFDTTVDEITDTYVRGEIAGEERERLERYFLKARERRVKARFASALLEHASATRPTPPVRTLIERLLEFFRPQSMAFKFAMRAAVLVLVVGIGILGIREWVRPQTFQAIELSMSSSDRNEAPQPKLLQLAPGTAGARITLNLPDQAERYQSYRVELGTRDGKKTPLEVKQQDARTVTAIAPVSLLKRGTYGIELTGIKADGNAEPLRGTYYFKVE